jgi:hypothetical protein
VSLFAADAIVIPVQMRTVSGIADPHRNRASSARCRTVGKYAASRTEKVLGRIKLLRSGPLRAVAMVVAGPAIVMAAGCVEAAAVGERRSAGNK